MSEYTWPQVLGHLLAGESLSREGASWAMRQIMQGEATASQFGAFVASLRAKGEAVDEIVGLVSTMREFSEKVSVDFPVVDTCGTGGDRSGTINVSTIAALVVAGAGGKVAKHGNRAASSSCGSADLLEELGVKIDASPVQVAQCITEVGIGFCFAPIFHPSMRHAAVPRRELGVPTVFNFLGPLTNPAGAKHQVLGVSDAAMAPKMAEVLRALGTTHALVVHGSDGLDEITTTGPTQVWEVTRDKVVQWTIDPTALGFAIAQPDSLKGGSVTENVKIALEVCAGTRGPEFDVVVINAAAGLVAADIAADMGAGVTLATESILSGRARESLDGLIEVSNRPVQ
ncbi:MAG: anthranilate phosphoribosyltransferase [Actinomycetota bacterium]